MALLRAETWTNNVFLGEWARGSGGERPVVEPATGRGLGSVGLAGEADLDRAVAVAQKAQPAWAAASAEERSAVLRRAGEALSRATTEVSGWLIREGGGTAEKAAFETELANGECFAAAALALHPVGDVIDAAGGGLSYSRRVPAGIAPFNAPLQLAMRSVAPALALGNAVILKPDPRTAVSGGVAVAAVFEAAGLPAGLLSVLPAGGEVGAALAARPEVDVVSFTGSTAVGRTVGQAAASHFAKAHLELGGNSALVVLPGVDVDWAARLGARGSFFHQGQICMATGRHLVHEDVADEYVAKLAAIADGLRVGDPTGPEVDLGPIIDERQRDRVHALVTGSLEQGAELVAGGRYEGLFYRPTVLAGVGPDAPAYANEVFGPVAAVRVFADVDEAVAIANDSEYGLALGVLVPDVALGLEIANRIPTGIAHINDQTIADTPLAPMGGLRASGAGSHFGGLGNLDAFTETRWTTVAAARASRG